jgi:hypothetical protein
MFMGVMVVDVSVLVVLFALIVWGAMAAGTGPKFPLQDSARSAVRAFLTASTTPPE